MTTKNTENFDICGVCSFGEIPKDCGTLLNSLHFRQIFPGLWLSARNKKYLGKHIHTSSDNTRWLLDAAQITNAFIKGFKQNNTNQFSVEGETVEKGDKHRSIMSQLFEASIGRGFLCVYEQPKTEKTAAIFTIASDRLGSQKIYYFYHKDVLAWSTVLPILMTLKSEFSGPATLSRSSLCGYLQYLHQAEDETVISGISVMPPASCLSISKSGLTVSAYWRPSFGTISESVSDLENRLRDLLYGEGFCNNLANGNTPGVLLSGGLDSSLITALLRKGGNDVYTYAVGFKEEPDELDDAQFVARHFGTTHRTVIIAPEDVEALLWDTVRALGFPTGNPSALATYRVARQARDEVGKLFSGLGSDELFAGHTKHIAARYWQVSRPLVSLVKKISSLKPGRKGSAHRKTDDITGYIDLYRYFNESELRQLLVRREKSNFKKLYTSHQKEDFYQSLFLIDVFSWLSDGLLPLAGTLAANQNLSFETPLCSDPMLEFAAKVPYSMKVRGYTGKWILRKVVADILPGSIFKKKRSGFTMPMGKWLKGPLHHLLHVYLNKKIVARRGIFQPDMIESMVKVHMQGRKDLSLQLWALITLEIWQQIFLD